eukprot:scaffold213845_cov27-Tisochrysis_lutea.AAC.1
MLVIGRLAEAWGALVRKRELVLAWPAREGLLLHKEMQAHMLTVVPAARVHHICRKVGGFAPAQHDVHDTPTILRQEEEPGIGHTHVDYHRADAAGAPSGREVGVQSLLTPRKAVQPSRSQEPRRHDTHGLAEAAGHL